jgi:hypothetical protein
MEVAKEKDNFKDIFNTLEDLYLLGDSSLYPLFERLHYHLNEIKSSPTEKDGASLSQLHSLFKEKIKAEIIELFRDSPSGTQIDLLNKMEDPTLKQMDTVLKVFPLAKELIQDFQVDKKVKILIENETIRFEGEVSLDKDLEGLRDQAYRLTRKLFEQRVLLTFDIFETSKKESFAIRFKFSFSHCDRKFNHQISANKTLVLPVLFERFSVALDKIRNIGSHPIFELTETFDLKVISEREDLDQFNTESDLAFHFPFLFRPISLIMRGYNSSGEEEYLSESDGTFESSSNLLFEIDLFSLLKK